MRCGFAHLFDNPKVPRRIVDEVASMEMRRAQRGGATIEMIRDISFMSLVILSVHSAEKGRNDKHLPFSETPRSLSVSHICICSM